MMFEEGFTWNSSERIWEIEKDPDATITCRLHWYYLELLLYDVHQFQWLRHDVVDSY